MRRSLSLVLSVLLVSTTVMAAPVSEVELDDPIMDRLLDEAVQKKNEQTELFQKTGNPAVLQDTSYFNPTSRSRSNKAEELPAKYDLREKGVVTPVKLQNPFGSCWGFAVIAAAESSILSELEKNGRKVDDPASMDLSEKHLVWFSSHALPEGSNLGQDGEGIYPGPGTSEGYNAGGWMYYGTTCFASGVGPRSEADFPYQPKDPENHIEGNGFCYTADADWSLEENERFGADYELEESSLLPTPAEYEENEDGKLVYKYNQAATDAIKSELMAGRAVSIAFCADTHLPGQQETAKYINVETWAHYTWDSEPLNHAVTIVGWDDTYAISNFLKGHQPEKPGAWIVKNSWGAESNTFPHKNNWGKDGYFYLSYYDRSIVRPETFDFFIEDEDAKSDKYYVDQHDYMTSSQMDIHASKEPVIEANVFKVEEDMTLRAIAATTAEADGMINYEVYRLKDGYTSPTDGERVVSVDAEYTYAGYHREDLRMYEENLHFHKGESYSIVVTQKSGDQYLYGAATELSKTWWESLPEEQRNSYNYSVGVINRGESFLGYRDESGEAEWMDWKDFTARYQVETQNLYAVDNFAIKGYGDPYTFPIELEKATVTLSSKSYTYNGKAKQPTVTVKAENETLMKDRDYTVTYKNNKNAGTATVTVKAKGTNYAGQKSLNFTIKKATQPLKLNVSKKSYKRTALKVKKATFRIKPTGNRAAVTYKVTKGSSKYISVSKNGVVTMKRGAVKGTYKVTVAAKALANYLSAKKTVTITVK